ncbi:MAG: ATP-dependent helicase [Deltaproteobacteria bacterium]|nr:ATP-dependent helicase [Deltaproteobacteria bacterium]
MENLLEGLDREQREAVSSSSKRLLVAAPPGSGKTRVLSLRFARLIKDGVDPSTLLAVTFTNRASIEMRERISALLPIDPALLNIGTFHSSCLKLLKKKTPLPVLYGREEQRKVLASLGAKRIDTLLERFSSFKNSGVPLSEEEQAAFHAYREALGSQGALDLDDLVPEAISLIEKEPGISPFLHLLVDEYQDINPVQARLVRLLAKESVFAIGDPDQAIYSFRGSSVRAFTGFTNDYPGCEVINLKRNYRSFASIVNASSALIAHNTDRIENTAQALKEGGEITAVECGCERAEAGFIIKEIEAMMGGLSSLTVKDHGDLKFSDFAVLFRTNRQGEALAEAFGRSPLPYHYAGPPGGGFYGFMEALRASEIKDDISLPGLIEATGKAIAADRYLSGLFLHSAKAFGSRPAKDVLPQFLDEMLLSGPSDNLDIKADKVNLLTLHSAKGLEFRVVFIAGFEDGLIPFTPKWNEADIEEERRLLYVAITRSKERLYLVSSDKRKVFGEEIRPERSRFLKELPPALLKKRTIEQKKLVRKPVQKGLFE